MLSEIVAFFATLVLLWGIGFGPALWVLEQKQRGMSLAFGLAPVVGVTMLQILGFPLVRFIAPVRVWALPFTIVMLIVSAGLTFVLMRGHPPQTLVGKNVRPQLFTVLFFLICCAVLLSPLVAFGIQYTVYRANPSDAFTYMTLAETSRVVDWHTILGGVHLTSANLAGVIALGNASPGALLSARALTVPLAINDMISLAWMTQINGLDVTRLYYPYHLLSFALTIPCSLVLGSLLKLPRLVNALASAAIAFGFWARYILESDAGYHIGSIPLLLLVVVAWMLLEQETPRLWSRARFLLSGAAVALAAVYVPIVPIVVGGFFLYYAAALVQRVRPIQALLYHGATLGLVILILAGTGQIDFLFANFLYELGPNVDNQQNFGPGPFRVLAADSFAGLWGMPSSMLSYQRFGFVVAAARRSADILAILLTLSLSATAIFSFRKTTSPALRILTCLVVASAIVFVIVLLRGNTRAAGKAVTFAYPWLVLGIAALPQVLTFNKFPQLSKAVLALGAVGLALQVCIGALIPFHKTMPDIFSTAQTNKKHSFEVSAVVNYLNTHPSDKLVVYVPPLEDWYYAMYALLVFAGYHPYFQSGLVLDNTTTYRTLRTGDLPWLPEYVLTSRTSDYVGPSGWGQKVAETTDLVLYQITSGDLTGFQNQDRAIRDNAMTKPEFPGLAVK